MKKIYIIPIGKVDSKICRDISKALKMTFHCNTTIDKALPVPEDSFNKIRKQYNSSIIIKKLQMLKPNNYSHRLGIIDLDLFIPQLNFVFGEANLLYNTAIISLTRLRQEFYRLPPDKNIFTLRAIKEAIHEIGHTCGLGHCINRKCIMYFSNTLKDTDIKGPGFCNICKNHL